jgi:hypothetical protein
MTSSTGAPAPALTRPPRLLQGYALFLTALLGPLGMAAYRQEASERVHFKEIDVERINIVEPDGKLRMVLSNRPRSIGPIYKGQPFGYAGGGRPGIIFFNDEGTENGGLTFAGRKGEDGRYAASTGFSFDQFNSDQVLYLQYNDDNGRRNMGLTVADRADVDIHDLVLRRDEILKMPEGPARTQALLEWQQPRDGVPLFAERVYVGRDTSKAAVVHLCDPNGKPRLRLKVDASGEPSLEFLDEKGNVTARMPEE